MIHTVILGAETPDAGELIRILAMHPEIELECAQSAQTGQRALTAIHHGLIGETTLSTCVRPDCERCDMIFDFSAKGEPDLTAALGTAFPDAKVIRMRRCRTADNAGLWTYALPEINRKALVRGARYADMPSPLASMALVALYPLALHMLLNGDLRLNFEAPQSIIDSTDVHDVEQEIQEVLSRSQLSFNGRVSISLTPSDTRRSAVMSVDMPCTVDLENLKQLYDIYDDHHFAFAVLGTTGPSEVAGTQKCVVALSKPAPDTVHVESVADCRMRGGAGEAVHILNLMGGLHERTGLALKAIDFHPM